MAAGCSAYRGDRAETLRIRGSGTMLFLAQDWAESYAKVDTRARCIAALVKDAIEIANCKP